MKVRYKIAGSMTEGTRTVFFEGEWLDDHGTAVRHAEDMWRQPTTKSVKIRSQTKLSARWGRVEDEVVDRPQEGLQGQPPDRPEQKPSDLR